MSTRTQPQSFYICDGCEQNIEEGEPLVLASGRTVANGKLPVGDGFLPDRHYHMFCWRRPEERATNSDERFESLRERAKALGGYLAVSHFPSGRPAKGERYFVYADYGEQPSLSATLDVLSGILDAAEREAAA